MKERRIKQIEKEKSQGKVSILRDIDLEKPHSGHVRILDDLNISKKNINSFRELNEYWLSVFDTSILNKKFYKDIANWYFWALKKVSFPFELPKDTKESKKDLMPITLIRFLTRLIFVWFLKEKKLIPESLFDEKILTGLMEGFSVKGKKTLFYTSILQNLFFGTLNTYRNADSLEESNESLSRKFRNPKRDKQGRTDDYMVTNLYRYESNFKDKKKILELLADVPFLNGGLFECLDRREGKEESETRLDCFSDVEKKQPNFPDYLFFSEGNEIDLSEDYGDKKRNSESVSGIIRILDKYKFTVEENTPLEEEVALDPELLGKVFENLLASFNPETSTTARKQTGSFYTPREIVNYMVEESLIAYYKNALLEEAIGHTVITSNENVMFPEAASGKRGQLELTAKLDNNPWKGKEEELEKKLRILLSDGNTENPFSQSDTEKLVRATGNAKILDPACGSGAFPMGVLHKMVYVLRKLDPENKRWKQEQIDRNELEKKEIEKRIDSDIEAVSKIHSEDVKKKAIAELEEKKKSIEVNFREHEADYARKLYLIENCIYGVDIQPIAVQITKLRFFISLIVDQKMNPAHKNLGIIPLPNLETKFVAANTLVGLEQPHEEELLSKKDSILLKLENELNTIRKKYFYSRSRSEKIKLKQNDKTLRDKILEHFLSKNDKFKKDLESILKIGRLPKESIKEIFEYIDNRESESASALQQLVTRLCKENKMDAGISKKAIAECNRYFPPKSASDIASWDPYNQNSHADWFDPEHMFGVASPPALSKGEGVSDGGFDVVIGNPPYVDIKALPTDEVKKYFKIFNTTENRINLYSIFIEKGMTLLNPNGRLIFINPNSMLINESYRKIRKFIVDGVEKIIKLPDSIFEKAIVETIIIQIAKFTKNETIQGLYFLNHEEVNLNQLNFRMFNRNEWQGDSDCRFNIFLEDKNSKIINKILSLSEYLEKFVFTSLGITPYDKYKGHSESLIENREYHSKTQKTKKHVPLISGKNIHKYFISDEIEEYLKYGDWLGAPREKKFFENPKLIVRQILSGNDLRIVAGYSDKPHYFTQIGFSLISKDEKKHSMKFFAALINSYLLSYYHKNKFLDTEKILFQKILIVNCKQLPIPRSPIDNPKLQQPLIALVDKILVAKGKDPLADTSKWENEIDARVFHLYGLTEEEMLTVLGSFPKLSIVEKDLIVKIYREVG